MSATITRNRKKQITSFLAYLPSWYKVKIWSEIGTDGKLKYYWNLNRTTTYQEVILLCSTKCTDDLNTSKDDLLDELTSWIECNPTMVNKKLLKNLKKVLEHYLK
jgi:hypothetical protein